MSTDVTGSKRTGRRVLLAKPRGYCAGVDRAVQAVELALDKFGPPVYVRRQIVHNTHVVAALEKRGAVFVDEVDEVPSGAVVVFSAHGIAPEVRLAAEQRGLRAIDATCPLVTKVHNEARRFAAKGYDILLVGHDGHEEVVGTSGEAPDRVRLVDGADGVANVQVRDPSRVVWLSQTTLSVDETAETVSALRERFPALLDPPSDDICYATQNRQAAVKVIAAQADLVIVVGSPNSSNSVRLVEVAGDHGAAAYLVDDAGEIDERWLDGVATVGVTSGASVPEELVTAVLGKLAGYGFGTVEQVEAVAEDMAFALPRELRAPRASRTLSARPPGPPVAGRAVRLPAPPGPVTAAHGHHDGERRAGEQPGRRGAQRDEDPLRGQERPGRREHLRAGGPGEEEQRRGHHHGPQAAGPGVVRNRTAAADERRARQRAPACPRGDQLGSEAQHEQRRERPAPGEPQRGLRF
jgi:4-hydroxy-3-methylbut-2-en-1-yl diphosphate reductase